MSSLYNNKHVIYSYKYNKKVLAIDSRLSYNPEPYYALEPEDKCRSLSLSIPYSLDNALERRAASLGLKKSRYVRLLIENDLKVEYPV